MAGIDAQGSPDSGPMCETLLALRRTCQLTEMLTEAHAVGVQPGTLDKPWEADAHRVLETIYASVFPEWYEVGLGGWFERVANELVTTAAPRGTAEDWSLAEHYFRSAAAVIRERHGPTTDSDDFSPSASPPPLLDYAAIASEVSTEGVRRLSEAMSAVLHAVEALVASPLTAIDAEMLVCLARGGSVDDAAFSVGYSRRTAYRVLAKLHADCGTTSRAELVAIAVNRGWIDPTITS